MLLSIDGVTAGYGRREAILEAISLEVDDGAAVGVVGLNGAGKSSLLKVVTGGLKPRKGQIVFEGASIGGASTAALARRGVVLLSEGHRVIRPLTVWENLEIATASLSKRRARKRLDEVLPTIYELFPILEERKKQASGLLSGGQQQMLSIARAIVQRPKLLLLDEPSLGLAPLIIDRIYESMAMLQSKGMSLLIVEQSRERIGRACSKILVLRGGRVVDEGRPADLQGDRFHRAYFGENSTAVAADDRVVDADLFQPDLRHS